ncbi:MAG: alpha-2-macroglobulin [Planctomycetota bacterium]|jgi:uncharacterized protein YfaS (alpha-2-macroglobulin family)|nr:alpha-2-macroglobulin [Planctomycetota bacterium]
MQACITLVLAAALFCFAAPAGEPGSTLRKNAEALVESGDYMAAWDIYEQLILDAAATPKTIEADLADLLDMIPMTGRTGRAEDILHRLEEERAGSWRVLAAVARGLGEKLPKDGYIVSGEFVRDRGLSSRGEYADADNRDRFDAIRLMIAAEPLLDSPDDPANKEEKCLFYSWLAHFVAPQRLRIQAWRLTALTDLETPPPYKTGYNRVRSDRNWPPVQGAPVDEEGNALFHPVPESWAAAENDGQRWRWALGQTAKQGDRGRDYADWQYASFLRDQFGVQTLDGRLPKQDGDAAGTNPFSVRTLDEDETIARLASGIKRFRLPEDSNFIALFRGVAERNGRRSENARQALASIFENRQQFDKAARLWRTLDEDYSAQDAKERLERITGNNGRLEPTPTLPAGTRPKLPYVFRNGDRVDLTALRLDERKFLDDIRKGMKRGDDEFWRRSPERIGHEFLEQGGDRYVIGKEAEWSVDLEPLPGHYSRRVQLELPLDRAGCYLVTAKMRDGNTSRVVVWVSDLALAAKTLGDERIHYVADAVTGRPVAKAGLDFFGYRHDYRERPGRPVHKTREIADSTDGNGLSIIPVERFKSYSWITVAESGGRLAFLGFNSVWGMDYDTADPDADRISAFIMTDRPVYRPDQTVHFKAWLGRHSYDQPDASPYAGRRTAVIINSPMGEEILNKNFVVDEYGGLSGELTLDDSAPLGGYSIRVGDYLGYSSFRLEEYRKPEFEVTVKAPEKALRLGDSAEVRIEAKYYFGSPVSSGELTYKVTRTEHSGAPLPAGAWDWLYGRGYWWTGYDYTWYPGWRDWGARRPPPFWFPPSRQSPPELVAEGSGVLDADGSYRIHIDTAVAKAIMGDRDHKYAIEAEVTDQSRRTIVGSGSVVAARKPFTVTVWADRGFYRVGDTVTASFAAMLPEGGGVSGDGEAVFYKVEYDDAGAASETRVDSWTIAADAAGRGSVKLRAGAPGQYRLSCVINDAAGVREEGGVVLTVRGANDEAGDYRFASLELIPEQSEYKPGDALRLAVGSERKDAVVLLFPYAGRQAPKGESHAPRVLRLEDGQAMFTMDIGAADQPNFFVEALTVINGRLHNEIREVFVPPAKQTLKVEVSPDSDAYLPGAPAKFSVRVEDEYGRPVRGQCVVALYDRSVEYVSGGSNVGDIREHFWSWKRRYRPSTQSSLKRWGYRVTRDDDGDWQPLGVFGALEMDWNREPEDDGPEPPMEIEDNLVLYEASPPKMAYYSAPVARMALPVAQAAAPMQDAVPAGDGEGAMAEAVVRSEFADTALWIAVLETDSAGLAKFNLDMPDNLTAWKAKVWTKASGTRVGEGMAEVVTRKNVIVRVQTPRFLTQKDRIVLTANIHNYLPSAKDARVEIELEGGLLVLENSETASKTVRVDAGGEARVNWIARAARPGEAVVRMRVLTDEESDAAEIKAPVIVHGARKVESFGGALRDGEASHSFLVNVPAQRLPGESRLRFTVSPTLASAMLEALPFLVEYPYGCTEQTLNRFLPALMTRRYLEHLGTSLAGGENVGGQVDRKSGEWLKRFGYSRARDKAPVFDDAVLDKIVTAGIERLLTMQNADGGWGWFSGTSERSWPHTTAVVVYGLLKARENGASVPDRAIVDGIAWLRDRQDREVDALKPHPADFDGGSKTHADNLDAFIYMTLAEEGRFNPDMRDFLFRDRQRLSLSGMSMLALALHKEGATNAFDVVFKNINQYVVRNERNATAWLERPTFGWWWWYNDEVETLAWYLKLASRVDPKGDDAAAVAKYLLQNRKNGSYWRSTRDTAYAIEALADFAARSGETAPDMTVSVYYAGDLVLKRKLDRETLLDEHVFILEGVAVETGNQEIRIEREGGGRLYFAGSLDVFSLEDPIPAAGGDLRIRRDFYKLVRDDRKEIAASATGAAAKETRVNYRRERLASPFDDGEVIPLEPGDLVEVELTIDAANDYEYLVFEDMKAAGLEAVELTSGHDHKNLGAYVEYRDQKVTMFLRDLPRGAYNLSYRLRAEVPGWFSALPTFGGGMYATDLFANSDEMKVKIAEVGIFE